MRQSECRHSPIPPFATSKPSVAVRPLVASLSTWIVGVGLLFPLEKVSAHLKGSLSLQLNQRFCLVLAFLGDLQ